MTPQHTAKSAAVALLAVIAAGCHAPPGAISVTLVTDRPDGMYKCGEQARFLVSASRDGNPLTAGRFRYVLTLDGVTEAAHGRGHLSIAPAEVPCTLAKPGIVRCAIFCRGGDEPKGEITAAAFDPQKIEPTTQEPADFSDFWDSQKAQLAAVPMDARLAQSSQFSDESVAVYKVSLGNIEQSRVYGWLGVPRRPGKVPAVLVSPHAGVYPITAASAVSWGRKGFLAMAISVHDQDVDLPAAKYEELADGLLRDYMYAGRGSRETYYFRRVFVGVIRAIEYLTSRPEWDRKHLTATGGSQGGALSVVAAALDPRVTAVAAVVPAMCDHTGPLHGRPGGWPHLLPDGDPNVAAVSAYYDTVNFARQLRCPTLMAIGLVDKACPPTTTYSAFNVIPGPKRMVSDPRMHHTPLRPDLATAVEEFVREQAAR